MSFLLIWQVLSMLGSIQFWTVVTVTFAIIYAFAPKKVKERIAWFIFGALPAAIISWVMAESLKLLFKFSRPCIGLEFCPTNYSFPSGHAAVIFAIMTVAIIYLKNRKLYLPFLALALLISSSRVFLGVHRIEDIIAGGIIGFFIGFLTYKNYEKVLNKVKWFQK